MSRTYVLLLLRLWLQFAAFVLVIALIALAVPSPWKNRLAAPVTIIGAVMLLRRFWLTAKQGNHS